MQAILLALGTLLLAVAGVVFTAVNWSRLDATAQGLVLLALTAAVAAATALAGRRSLPATAEALGLVTVVLALVDAHAARVSVWPDVGLAGFWAGGLAVVSALAWWLAAATGIRSTELVAVSVAQVPLVLVLAGSGAGGTTAGLALLAQTAVVLALTAVTHDIGGALHPLTRAFALAPAFVTWLVTTTAAALWLLVDGPEESPGLVLVVAAAAAVALLAAVCWAHLDGVRSLALLVATTAALAAGAWALRLLVEPPTTVALLALLAAAVTGLGLRVSSRWGSVPAGVATVWAGLAALALLQPIDLVVGRLLDLSGDPWQLEASDRAVAAHLATGHASPGTVAMHLAGLVVLLVAWMPRADRRLPALGALVLSIGALALAPVMLPLSIGGAAALAWIGVAVVVAGVEIRFRTVDGDEGLARLLLAAGCAASVALFALAGWWSTASSALSVTTGAVAAATAVWAVARGWWVQHIRLARSAAGLTVLAVAVEAAMVAAIQGASPATAFAWAGAAGLAAAAIGLLLLPPRLSVGGELIGWYLHGLAVLALVVAVDGAGGGASGPGGASLDAAWRITLSSGAIAACVRAARGRALLFAAVAAAEALVLWWIELAVGGVQAPEPYTLPLAGLLTAAGVVAERRAPTGARPRSWVTAGPALIVASVPTVWLSLLEPGGVRPLLALVSAVAVLAAGAFAGHRAAVDVGAGTVAVLGLARLVPVLADAPNWLTIGLTGAVLVAVGATFEQRRQDVRGMRDRYSALR